MERNGRDLASRSSRELASRSRASTSGAFRIGSSSAPYKIVLTGVVGVGKSSLLERFRSGKFVDKDPRQHSSIGSPCTDRHTVKRTVDANTITVDIFDTAGLERYDSLTPNYYANSRAVLLVFNLTDSSTMHALSAFREQAAEGPIAVNDDCYFALVGNKVDLEIDSPMSQIQDAKVALKCDGLFLTSAKTGEGVDQLLTTVIEEMYRRAKADTEPQSTPVVVSVRKRKHCCK